MNNNKAARILNVIFSFIFTVVFVRLLVLILAIGYTHNREQYTYNCSFDDYIKIIITGIVLTFIFSAVYYALHTCRLHKIRRKITDSTRQTRIIIIACIAVMLVLQILAAYFLASKPVTDLILVNRYAKSFAQTGNFDLIQKDLTSGTDYMIRYPNNLMLMFILSFAYRVNYLITGYVSNYTGIVLNIIAINLSVILTVFLAQKLFGNKKALMTLMLCMLFVPYYTYVPYYYTDSLSMPFFIGGVYLFFSALRCEKKYKKYVLMFICGALIMLGFKVKGSVLILLVVAIVYMLLKLKFKRFICFALALVAGFGCFYGAFSAAYRAADIITPEQEYKYEFPASHWIMMGIKGYGCYTQVDANYTASFEGKDAKNKAVQYMLDKRINQRLTQEDGIDSMYTHLNRKMVWTWEDGSYFISHHISRPIRKNILHSFVLNEGKYHAIYYAYCSGFQLFLILMMAISSFRCLWRRKVDELVLFRGVVFAIFVFLLIWETRSRYLYNFTPAFILLAVDGLDGVKSAVDFVRNKLSAKKNK